MVSCLVLQADTQLSREYWVQNAETRRDRMPEETVAESPASEPHVKVG